MRQGWLGTVGVALLLGTAAPRPVAAQGEPGPYARIAILRPHDGDTVDFEAGYLLIAKTTIEILTLRPTMSLGLAWPARP